MMRGLSLFIFMTTLLSGCGTPDYLKSDKTEAEKRQEAAENSKWKETARSQIEQRGEDVRICGDKFPEAYKNYTKNVVRIEFTVAGDGVVQRIRSIQNTTGSKGIEKCLIQAFKSTKFNPVPKHAAFMTFSFPFEFKTGAQTIH